MSPMLKLMRPKQWVKNVFVLSPLLFAGLYTDLGAVLNALVATGLFCLTSSAAYIVNDICDVEADRKHPRKSKERPLASGAVSLRGALVLLGALYAAIAASFFFVPAVALVLVGYILLNIAYSLVLKHQPVIDIFTPSIGFVLRVYVGGVAIASPMSSWGFITTLCLALFLASLKRRQELQMVGTEGRGVLQHYSVPLIDRYAMISSTGAMVFYSLFVMSERPELVVTIPFVLFGLFRYWFVVDQLDGGESPTDTLFKDWQLGATVAGWAAAAAYVLWPGF